MHYIQKHILDSLRATDTVRYAQLNTQDVENGHFRYHLTQLINDGYVAQLDRGLYGLTKSGQQYVDKLSQKNFKAMPMPKVITYTLLTSGDSVILQQKQKQPYLHLLNMIGGKLHEGETSQQAAVREVKEKTGNTIGLPRLAGVFEVMISNEDTIHTHVIAYVYVANVNAAEYTQPTLHTIPITQLQNTAQLAPDFLPLFNKIQNAGVVQTGIIQIMTS